MSVKRDVLDLGSWCILRCAGASTLKVSEALSEKGFEVWTPTISITKRMGRTRKPEKVSVPLLPGFVFGAYSQVPDLIALARTPALTYQIWDTEREKMVTKGCPHFAVLLECGRPGRVANRQLNPLRLEERRCTPKEEQPTFKVEDEVRHPGNGFEGMLGTIEGKKGRKLHVRFTDPLRESLSITVDFEPWQLIAA